VLWLVYALGGGWGHLTRAAALARAAAGRHTVRILTNSPYAGLVRERLPGVEVTERVDVRDCGGDRLIVDTFPRGLVGELAAQSPDLRIPRILIHRDLNPRYIARYRLHAFVETHYDLVIVPGAAEFCAFHPAVTTAPWLIRSAHELPSREAARAALGLGGQPCVLVCASGNRDEVPWFERAANALAAALPHAAVRLASGYWPAMDLLPAASVVVGGAGYNTVNECAACGVPLVARPWPRLYDRQDRRAAAHANVTAVETPEEAAAAAGRLLDQPRPPTPAYANGAIEAVALIESRGAGAHACGLDTRVQATPCADRSVRAAD
jgi:hypothetical protein